MCVDVNKVSIKTTYKGQEFRSKLEAKFAYILDKVGIAWEYEKERYELDDGLSYLPDFYLPTWDVYVEGKGFMTSADREKIEGFMNAYGARVYVLYTDLSICEYDEKDEVYLTKNGFAKEKDDEVQAVFEKADSLRFDEVSLAKESTDSELSKLLNLKVDYLNDYYVVDYGRKIITNKVSDNRTYADTEFRIYIKCSERKDFKIRLDYHGFEIITVYSYEKLVKPTCYQLWGMAVNLFKAGVTEDFLNSSITQDGCNHLMSYLMKEEASLKKVICTEG